MPGDQSQGRRPRLFAHRGRRTVDSSRLVDSPGTDESLPVSLAADAALLRDRQLLGRWQAGDPQAGVELLDHYAAYVHRVALRMGVPAAEFEEFWQDLALRLVQQLSELNERVRTSFAGFLAWQVRDLLRNWRRRSRRTATTELPPMAAVGLDVGQRSAFWEALHDCSGRLPPREQVVFEHRFLAGLDLGEVAARVGSNANAVAQAVFRLVRRLRDCLYSKGFDGPGDLL